MKHDFDIIICGGGPAGASVACALAGSNFSIAVIEPEPVRQAARPSADDRMLALTYASKLLYERLRIWENLPPEQVAAITAIEVSERGRNRSARLDAADIGREALGWNVSERALCELLYDQLRSLDNVEIFSPATAESASIDRDVARVEIASGEKTSLLDSKLIVVADGGRTRLLGQLGFNVRVKQYSQHALVCRLSLDRNHDGLAHECFTPSGPIALLPAGESEYALVWTAEARICEDLATCDAQQFLTRLEDELAGRGLDLKDVVGQRAVYPLARTWPRSAVKERAVAIGNAAHTVHPVAGQGLNLGLREIFNLSEILRRRARHGWDIGSIYVLSQFERHRRSEGRAVSAFTDGLIRVFASRQPPIRLARTLGIAAVQTLPPARRFLLSRTAGLRSLNRRLSAYDTAQENRH